MSFLKNKHGKTDFLAIFLVVFVLVLMVGGVSYFSAHRGEDKVLVEGGERLIGGDKDEGGCLVGAGYSWCEVKNKCLRVWEEACIEDNLQQKIETYLKENISELSPAKEVLGGKFFVTKFRFIDDQNVVIDYEDGHNLYQADVVFLIEGDDVTIHEFSLVEDDGINNEENLGAFALLTEIFSQELGVDLKGQMMNSVDVVWNTESGEEKYLGYGHGLSDVAESEKIENFYNQIIENLKSKGFKTDPYNAMSGSDTFNQNRLKNDSVICNVIKRTVVEKDNNQEIELRCADVKDSYTEGDKNWQIIKNAIANCQVESVMQAHSGRVSAELKDGSEINAIQPKIDNIIDLAVVAQGKCGEIIMATE